MTLRPGEVPGRTIAVFPFLKTQDPITLGNFVFRSTDDTNELNPDDAAHVREIADMLYLQDDLKIKPASYAVLPAVDLDKEEMDQTVAELERIQAVVAFCYSHPHQTFGTPFFSFEQSSLAIFSPEPVSIFMVRPEHGVAADRTSAELKQDEWHRIAGYYGRYNFIHPFWVVKASRLYPPVPHMALNDSQDLAYNIGNCFHSKRYGLLPELLKGQRSPAEERVRKRSGGSTAPTCWAVTNIARFLIYQSHSRHFWVCRERRKRIALWMPYHFYLVASRGLIAGQSNSTKHALISHTRERRTSCVSRRRERRDRKIA